MKKLKKYQRVERFLTKLYQSEDFSISDFETLKYKHLAEETELEGIGDRTISNCISDFQKKHGINSKKNIRTKKMIIEDYLNRRIEEDLSIESLLELNYKDLINVNELKEVGKTTLISTLSQYKKNKKQSFEEGIIGFLEKEKTEIESTNEEPQKADDPQTHSMPRARSIFDNNDVILLKEMIRKFEQNRSIFQDNSEFELFELKNALSHVGINPGKIVRLYEKTVSRKMLPSSIIAEHVKKSAYSTAY